ncbi:hypothetical protein FKW77_005467 [Venturia effusa]|uniref:Uncharacterized protein n=1 Tax=Venturia effusa TaxID=50376 RepID=A0A517L1D7_9PEZI|nr:hypothetical protein FKW77_005467 [Venturia effusa]
MSRETSPANRTFSTQTSRRAEAQNFLRLAFDSDDRRLQGIYLNAARQILAEMESEVDKSRIDGLGRDESRSLERDPPRGGSTKMESKDENDDDGFGEAQPPHGRESDSAEERSTSESEEDRQWRQDDYPHSEEEDWDVNNGESSARSPPAEEPPLAHSDKFKQDLHSHNDSTTPNRFNLPVQEILRVSNMDVRVYARMMELFEIESRHRLSICNSEQALHEARKKPA